jgi:hypothetical protein
MEVPSVKIEKSPPDAVGAYVPCMKNIQDPPKTDVTFEPGTKATCEICPFPPPPSITIKEFALVLSFKLLPPALATVAVPSWYISSEMLDAE